MRASYPDAWQCICDKDWRSRREEKSELQIPGYFKLLGIHTTLEPNNICSLFPHVRLSQQDSYLIDCNIPVKRQYNILPTLFPHTHVVLIHPSESHLKDHIAKLVLWLVESLGIESEDSQYRRILNKRILMAYALHTTRNIATSLHISNKDIWIVQFCHDNNQYCLRLPGAYDLWRAMGNVSECTKLILTPLCFGNPGLNRLLLIFPFRRRRVYSREVIITALVNQKLQICDKEINDADYVGKKQFLIADGYAKLWLSFLGNVSCDFTSKFHTPHHSSSDETIVVTDEGLRTLFGITVEIKGTLTDVPTGASVILYQAVASSVYVDLKLVVCGYQGLENLAFLELTNAFDKIVWLSLLIFVATTTLIMSQIPSASKISIAQGALVPVRILLEQGDPFPESLLNHDRGRCVAATLLFMGFILSNAYKTRTCIT